MPRNKYVKLNKRSFKLGISKDSIFAQDSVALTLVIKAEEDQGEDDPTRNEVKQLIKSLNKDGWDVEFMVEVVEKVTVEGVKH